MNSTERAVVGRELLNGSLDVMRLALLETMALYGYQIDKHVRAAVAAKRQS